MVDTGLMLGLVTVPEIYGGEKNVYRLEATFCIRLFHPGITECILVV